MAYLGDPVLAEDLVFRPVHSIIDQSLHAKLTGVTTNGDGFGIGWYGDRPVPSVYKGTHPAWNDANLREVAGHIRTPLLFAHVRASSGTPVQRSNCHPFRHDRWLWMHNGSIANFSEIRRDLLMAVDPSIFPQMEGSTDSEALFFLALTFGLTDDPPTAVARAVGFVEDVGRRHGVQYPVHMTVATNRRRICLGLPVLHGEEHQFPVLLHGRRAGPAAVPTTGCSESAGKRRAVHRFGASAGPAGSLERSAGQFLRRHPSGR